MNPTDAFIVDGTRTPFGRFAGALSAMRTDDLAAHPIRALAERHPDLPWASVDDVVLGNANQAGRTTATSPVWRACSPVCRWKCRGDGQPPVRLGAGGADLCRAQHPRGRGRFLRGGGR